jgi:hypothetical protein
LHQVGDLFKLNVKLRCQKLIRQNILIIKSPISKTQEHYFTYNTNMSVRDLKLIFWNENFNFYGIYIYIYILQV